MIPCFNKPFALTIFDWPAWTFPVIIKGCMSINRRPRVETKTGIDFFKLSHSDNRGLKFLSSHCYWLILLTQVVSCGKFSSHGIDNVQYIMHRMAYDVWFIVDIYFMLWFSLRSVSAFHGVYRLLWDKYDNCLS